MDLPRISKSIFLDQFIYMQLSGAAIGVVFPFFLRAQGFIESDALSSDMFLMSLLIGQVAGLVSFFITSVVTRRYLKKMSEKMAIVSSGLNNDTFLSKGNSHDELFMTVDSLDEVGVVKDSYNTLLASLIKHHEFNAAFNRFNKITSKNQTTSSICESVSSLLISLTNIDAVAIFVYRKGNVVLEYSEGFMNPDLLDEHPELKASFGTDTPKVIKSPKGFNLDFSLSGNKPIEGFIQPIEFEDKEIGMIFSVSAKAEADEKTYMMLNMFYQSLGLALNNAIYHTELKKLAAYDSLTNIYNRRFGQEKLRMDYSRAVRNNSPLTLIMLDIDHFKSVNDTYGHLVGDQVLVEFSNILKRALREGDVVARYGGEEFMMILPGTDINNAKLVAERVRSTVEDTPFSDGNSGCFNVTTSLGICSYPYATLVDELDFIDKADKALYIAKQNGRNRYVTYS